MKKRENTMPAVSLHQITIELTNRCNLRCRMCTIWKEKKKHDIDPATIPAILALSNKPLQIALTGGEPLLHPQFEAIYTRLYQAYRAKKVSGIDISTNATPQALAEFLMKRTALLKPLSLSISLDGLPAIHNIQRGHPRAFTRMIKNIALARKLNIPVDATFTITSLNYKNIRQTYALSRRLNIPLVIKIAELNNQRYYHRQGPAEHLGLTPLMRKKTISQLRGIYQKELRRRKKADVAVNAIGILSRYLATGTLDDIRTCATPAHSLFISYNAIIYSCLYLDPVGYLKGGAQAKIDLRKFKRIQRQAHNGDCPKCLAYHGFLKEYNAAELKRIVQAV